MWKENFWKVMKIGQLGETKRWLRLRPLGESTVIEWVHTYIYLRFWVAKWPNLPFFQSNMQKHHEWPGLRSGPELVMFVCVSDVRVKELSSLCCFVLYYVLVKVEEEIYDKVVDLTEYAKRQRWWNRVFGKNSGPVAEKYSVATQIAIGGASGW